MSDAKFLAELDPDAEPLEILIAPHPKLRTVAEKCTPEDIEEIKKILPSMFAAMRKAPGIGLAATQVDYHKRFFIMDLSHDEDKPDPRVFINPEVINPSEEISVRQEGCLTVPGQYADVSRPAQVTLRYETLSGEIKEEPATDLKAACFQHETDHLNGILFVDHLSPMKRNMLLKKLAKSRKRH